MTVIALMVAVAVVANLAQPRPHLRLAGAVASGALRGVWITSGLLLAIVLPVVLG